MPVIVRGGEAAAGALVVGVEAVLVLLLPLAQGLEVCEGLQEEQPQECVGDSHHSGVEAHVAGAAGLSSCRVVKCQSSPRVGYCTLSIT